MTDISQVLAEGWDLFRALADASMAYAAVFAVSAFSVPLLFDRRANLVQAIHGSVRAVLTSPLPCLAWGLLISGSTVLSILVLPAFVVILPVLAFASFALYLRVFPQEA